MQNVTKNTIIDILFKNNNYFLPYCLNQNWNCLYAIDKIKLTYILDNLEWSFFFEKTMINEKVYSIIVEFSSIVNKETFLIYDKDNNENDVKNIQIFLSKNDMIKIKNELFKDTKDEFWKDIE